MFHKFATTDRVYWALILQEEGATFRRVGVAMLYPEACDMRYRAPYEFEII